MFESAELGHSIDKQTYQEQAPALRTALLDAQYELKERGEFPVIVLVNGIDGAGRSETLSQFSNWLDARLLRINAQTNLEDYINDEGTARPWLWRYWNALPPKGHIGVLYGSWYSDLLFGRSYRAISEKQALTGIDEVQALEKQLVADGALIIKIWLHLSRDKQKKRLKQLEKDPANRWRVNERDWKNHKNYDEIITQAERLLRVTGTGEAPWVLVEGEDDNFRELTIANVLLQALRSRLDKTERRHPPARQLEVSPLLPPLDGLMLLDRLKLDQPMDKTTYRDRLSVLQARLARLIRHPKFERHSLVLVFEGNDAAGKGGAIRRVNQVLDPRRSRVIPIAAPTAEEKAMPWLWRFWHHVPPLQNVTVFDRSWYGRVLVERVEGFSGEYDWMRAYSEINAFERQLHAAGTIVVKFWLAISNEEQLRRFKEREETGFKRYKITEEDWRNRDRWDDYKHAVCDMIDRTSTQLAPWTLVEANNKYYARIKVLETLCHAIEARFEAE